MQENRETEIWERVMAASAAYPQMPSPAQKAAAPKAALTAEELQSLMVQRLQAAGTYRALAGRVRYRPRQQLLQLARETQKQARQLEAVYYLLAGRRPCPGQIAVPCIACTNEELRRAHGQEQAFAARCQVLAEDLEQFSGLFGAMRRTSLRHSATLVELLQWCL